MAYTSPPSTRELMRKNSVDLIHARGLFRYQLKREHFLNDSATHVLGNAIQDVQYVEQPNFREFLRTYSCQMRFRNMQGDIIDKQKYSIRLDDIGFRQPAGYQEHVIDKLVKDTICGCAANGDLVAKLCLAYADEILRIEQSGGHYGTEGFDPAIWSSRVKQNFENSMVMYNKVDSLLGGSDA